MSERLVDTLVTVEEGVLRGTGSANGVCVFRAIPYAAPPVGPLRWCPPRPASGWQGARDATRFADDCTQVYPAIPTLDAGRSQAPGKSEDCLYLNVWTPHPGGQAKLPVLVWFHGGGFVRGSAAEPTYDGVSLAGQGVVVVSVNYRLGAFGFFAHPELSRESGRGASGNYGLMDTIAALRWIRANIAAFGGDPDCVTISGQSAGGAIVGNLLVSPEAKGLFQRAIPMSPGSFRPLATLADAEQYGLMAGDDIAALRQLDAAAVLALNANYVPKARGLTTPRMLRPIVDGWIIPRQEIDMFLAGQFHPVPLLVGTCEDEGSMLVGSSKMDSLTEFQSFIAANFGAQAQDALALYPAATDADVLPAYEVALGDSQFQYAARGMGRVMAPVQRDTYRYYFTRRMSGLLRPAQHCDDIPFVFGTLDTAAQTLGLGEQGAGERALSATMQAAWVRFMASGNPNGPGVPIWPAYHGDADQALEFGDHIRLVERLRRPQMDLLDRTYGLFGGA
jgi:carboxylesterase type B